MDPVRKIAGRAMPLDRSDVDTDQIIPATYLKRVERTGFGEGLFSSWRENDKNFVLNRPEFEGASVLVAGPNFGTGSSREHAVWALMDYGFKAVISPRFGDIFRNNALKAGLLVIESPIREVEKLWEHAELHPEQPVEVDLAANEIRCAGSTTPFAVDPYSRWRLLEGLDDIALTERHNELVTQFEKTRPERLPSLS